MKFYISPFDTKQWLCILYVPLLISGCSIASTGKIEKHIEIDSWQFNQTDAKLETLTINALNLFGKELISSVPKDINEYCPNYKNAKNKDKIKFWSALISSLSYFESSHSSKVSYTESFTNTQKKKVVSRGLLQISIESSKGYQCHVSKEKQLHNPQENLQCGVKILSQLVTRDGVISGKKQKLISKGNWLGAARYWSPFRDSKKKQMMAINTKKQSYCQ